MRLTHQLTCRCVPSQALASSGLPRSSSWRPFSSHINHQLADHQHVCVGHRCRGHRCRVLSSRASCPLRLVLCIDFVLHVRIDFESAKRAGRRSASVDGARVWAPAERACAWSVRAERDWIVSGPYALNRNGPAVLFGLSCGHAAMCWAREDACTRGCARARMCARGCTRAHKHMLLYMYVLGAGAQDLLGCVTRTPPKRGVLTCLVLGGGSLGPPLGS